MSYSDSDASMADAGSDFSDAESSFEAEENFAPVAAAKSKAKAKPKAVVAAKAAVAKGKGGGAAAAKSKKQQQQAPSSVLSNRSDNMVEVASIRPEIAAAKDAGSKKTIEEMYQKKTQLEHILLRPDTYIGSVEPHEQPMFILENGKIVERNITFTPGLYKIFDEIVVNAADNKQRDGSMDRMDITIDVDANMISVLNNGKGIPIHMHAEHQVYVPTLIFGHLLTGSNFDDGEKKTTGGRNGYGAKLANVFSTKFIVECVDTEHGLFFEQTFRNNMSVAENPIVKKLTKAQVKNKDYVKISFSPDLVRFNMDKLDDNTVALLSKRAYDIAGSMAFNTGKKLTVSLNGEKLAIKSFKDYLGTFGGINPIVAYEKTDRWEIAIAPSVEGTHQQVSFVNSISTSKGGGHVQYVMDQIVAHLKKTLNKKKKGSVEIAPAMIKNHLAIFVNCLIENPAFDSQTKDYLTTRPKDFGSTCKLTDVVLKKIEKSDVVGNILSYATFRDNQKMKRKGGTKKVKLTGIAKLDDANLAGSAKSADCTLIITEGDSAKSLAMSGLSVVGRDHYGVFPLKGKPMNVRDATGQQVTSNEEIKNLVDILGLKFQTVYDETNIKTLRYGHLMIMADQDTDGSHIKGLIINFIHNFWPSLLDIPGFLQQFITPIVKVTKGKTTKSFFNLPEYENWLEATGNEGKGWTIKYYKGLGTSTSAEAKEYFSNLDLHEVHFAPLQFDKVEPADGGNEMSDVLPDVTPSGSDMIDMVFRKTRVEDRKQWLNGLTKDTFLDYTEVKEEGVKYSDFINKEYILFSQYDNVRSIPNVLDGFKPSQRKVLFGCIKRKLKGEIKVAQLTGYIAEHSAYHHGEASLQGTIVCMAQNYPGANNVNLLTPSGQFGTRRMGGKDAASARYIFTKLEPITRAIYHPDDDELLTYLQDDGAQIEPEYYLPVIPMILVNGAEGIGTGWRSSVNNYNPRDVIDNLRRLIKGEEMKDMLPYYYGFTGDILPEGKKGSYTANGRIERLDDTTLLITELPVGKWTQDYKIFLEKMMVGDSKTPPEIDDFSENHTDTTVSFTVKSTQESIDKWEKEKEGLLGKFKLKGSLSTSCMYLFDKEGRITKYETPEDIISAFYDVRVDFYGKRKALLVDKLRTEQRKLSNKARFVEEVCNGDLIVSNRKRSVILAELQKRGYETFAPAAKDAGNSEDEDDEAETQLSDSELAKGYEYLLGMKIWSLTFEKAEELRSQLADKTKQLQELEATAPTQMWLNDLDAIEVALDERHCLMVQAAENEQKAQKKGAAHRIAQGKKKKAAATKKTKKKAGEWDSDMETSDEEEKLPARKPVVARKPAAVKKTHTVAPPKAVAAKAPAKPPSVEDTTNRLSESLHVSPAPKKADTAKRTSSPVLDSDHSEVEVVKKQPVKKQPVARKNTIALPKKKKPSFDESDDSDAMNFSDEESTMAAAAPVARRDAPRRTRPAKKYVESSGSESEDSESSDDDE